MGTLATLRPADHETAGVYAVPFSLDRRAAPLYRLHNRSCESIYGVALAVLGAGMISPSSPSRLEPGESLQFRVRATDPARETVAIVRWFRPEGSEYLWRISF